MSTAGDSSGAGGGPSSTLTIQKTPAFGIDKILCSKSSISTDQKKQENDLHSVITPYNFLTASSAELSKARAGSSVTTTTTTTYTTETNVTSTTRQHGDNLPDSVTVTRGNTSPVGLPPLRLTIVNKRIRKPSATVTSSAIGPDLDTQPETELKPIDISTKTTIERTVSSASGTSGDNNKVDHLLLSPTITTVKMERTLKYAEFGLPVDAVDAIHRVLKFQLDNPGPPIGRNGDIPIQPIPGLDDIDIRPLSPEGPQEIDNWVPFPPELANGKRVKKSFTDEMFDMLNQQIREYHVINQQTVAAKKAQALLTPPNTRSRSRSKVGSKIPRAQIPKSYNTVVPQEPTTTAKSPRGRKKKEPEALVTFDPVQPKQKKPKASPKPKKVKRVNYFDPDSPIPLIFVDCLFCAVSKPTTESMRIESCGHIFCRDCLGNFIEHSAEPQISCPVRDEGKCNGVLSDPEIKELVSEDEFQKYLSRSLASALAADNQLTPCFFPGCTGISLIEGNLRLFYCPLCSKLNCLDCKTTHEGRCMKNRRPIGIEKNGVVHIDGSDEDSMLAADDGEVKDNTLIAMKAPVAETDEEMKIRLEWEASWALMESKFKEGKEGGAATTDEAAVAQAQLNVFADLITTDHVFECPICFVDAEVGEGVILQECFHRFCRECLVGSIQHSEEIRVKCPYQSGNYSCQMHISDKEVRALASEEIYDNLLKKSLAAAEIGMSNAFHCQSVNCTGWAEIANNQVQTFRCYICSKTNCVPCKAIHDKLTCAEYQSKLKEGEFELASKEALNLMIQKGEAMKCPTCKVVIIKNGGCDGMTCTVCQTHICWATKGPRWGPMGRGDESAGCRCGYNGKKCHPKCGNCH